MWEYGYRRRRPPKPRKVRNGIKAQSRRGRFGKNWWSMTWLDMLDGLNYHNLDRGKPYARRGQVISIDVQKGSITASVQGSKPAPYAVRIRVQQISGEWWRGLARVLYRRPADAAKLLAGRMPEGIEDAFGETGAALFPRSRKEFHNMCDCNDWGELCKHVAAVHLLVGEEFDRDPLLMLKLRGADRDELLDMLGSFGAEDSAGADPGAEAATDDPRPGPPPADPGRFWGRADRAPHDPDIAGMPDATAALPKRLGDFPLWRSKKKFIPELEAMYDSASRAGLGVLLGESRFGGEDTGRRRGRPPGGSRAKDLQEGKYAQPPQKSDVPPPRKRGRPPGGSRAKDLQEGKYAQPQRRWGTLPGRSRHHEKRSPV